MKKIYKINELIKILQPIFEANNIYKAILFGSYARGEANANSDIDIVIDSKGELLNIKFYGVLQDIIDNVKKKVDLIEMTEIKENSSIYNKIKEEGILIYER